MPNEADLLNIDRELAKRSLSDFVQMAWPVLEPGELYMHNWHMDAMGEHLQAVSSGEITRLLINVPPGTSKSSMSSVFFPAWLWGPAGMPHKRFIGAAHEQTLATRDNRRTRLLVESDWYQRRWPTKITSDQNEKTFFENESRGFRQSSAVASMTGKRGHVVTWDDPINPEDANRPLARETAVRIFTETLPSRMVSPEKSAIVIIMQRLHQEDVSGYILENDLGYEHLCLPMEFEPDRKCYTSIGFEDPRKKDGELLFPDRFPRSVVERDKRVMGTYATAGQFQQRPAPREGGLFKRDWFDIIPAAPANCTWMRGWDLASSESETSDWTAGCLMGRTPGGEYIIADMARFRGSPAKVDRMLKSTASQDGRRVKGSIPQDPGQAGKSQVAYLIKQLAGFNYRSSTESGSKETRAEPLAAQAEAGNVKLVEGDWNKAFLDELSDFPVAKYDDQVDAASRAFNELVNASNYDLKGML